MRMPTWTIWGTELPEEEKLLKRVILPVFDTFLILAGLSAVRGEITGFADIFPEPLSDGLAYAFTAVAFLCLLGIAFPRLWKMEIFFKIQLIGLLGAYFVTLCILQWNERSDGRGFIAWLVLCVMLIPFYRLGELGRDIRKRREVKALIEAELA